jgi:molybdopterin synthase catalytic subunit
LAKRLARLTRKSIDPAAVVRAVQDDGAGSVVLFLGTVRDIGEVGRVTEMEYEAYAPMAEKALIDAERAALSAWPSIRKVKVLHRVGHLRVGDVSVAVAVSSPHRAEGFEACRQIIETIKHAVPIWKKEIAKGKEAWVGGTILAAGSGNPKQRR